MYEAAMTIQKMNKLQSLANDFGNRFVRLEANYHKELIQLGAMAMDELMEWADDIDHARNIIAHRLNLSNNQANDMIIIYKRNNGIK